MQRSSRSLCGNVQVNVLVDSDEPGEGGTHDSVVQNVQQRFHIIVINIFLCRVLPVTGGEPVGETTTNLSLHLQTDGRQTPPLLRMTYGKVRTWFL